MLYRVIAINEERTEAYAEKINVNNLDVTDNCLVLDGEKKVILMPYNWFDDIVINPVILHECPGGQIYRIKLPEDFDDEEE